MSFDSAAAANVSRLLLDMWNRWLIAMELGLGLLKGELLHSGGNVNSDVGALCPRANLLLTVMLVASLELEGSIGKLVGSQRPESWASSK